MKRNYEDILFIGPENDHGGIGSVLKIYEKYLPGFKFIGTYTDKNIFYKTKYFVSQLLKINKYTKSNKKIRIYHIHSASRGSFIRKSMICLLGKLLGKKVILHMHGGSFKEFYEKSFILKIFINFILKKCDLVICLSKEWELYFSEKINLKNIITIGNPVEKINIIRIKRDNNKLIKILFLGKICDEKGIFELIEYLKFSSYFINGNIKLSIAGIGEDVRLEKIISEDIFKNKIEYLGWIDGEKKYKALANCDIFILPSHFEGLPISILEAMSFGKTIISTNVGGISSIVKPGYNGWLIHPGKLKELDEIFEKIYSTPEILEIYSNNSQTEIEKYYPEIIVKNLSQEYDKLVMENSQK